MEQKKGLLRHIVLLSFNPDAPITDIEKAFNALPSEVNHNAGRDIIKSYEFGTNTYTVNLRNKNFTHCYFLTFDGTGDYDIYENDPSHKKFKETYFTKENLADAIIFCYFPDPSF